MGINFEHIKDTQTPSVTTYQFVRVKTNNTSQNPAYEMTDPDGNGWIAFSNAVSGDSYILASLTSGSFDTTFISVNRPVAEILLHHPVSLIVSSEPDTDGQAWIWGNGEVMVKDASGNVTTVSPHNIDGIPDDIGNPYPVTLHHKNEYLGLEEWIDVRRMAMLVEQITGETLVYSHEIQKKSWDSDQQKLKARRDKEIEEYDKQLDRIRELPQKERDEKLRKMKPRPDSYIVKPIPGWIKDRLEK